MALTTHSAMRSSRATIAAAAVRRAALQTRSVATVRDQPGQPVAKPPTAVVMMNMGGPSDIPGVHDFLRRLFLDSDLIPLPAQRFLAPLIAKRRTPKIEEQYREIGGGSPIRAWTQAQGEAMCQLLDETNPESAPHKPYIAFRYAPPLTETTIAEMKADGVKRAVALSKYPQYSCSTTGSSLNELKRVIQKDGDGGIEWSIIDRWPANRGLAKAFAENIRRALQTYPPERRNDVVLLFSAHSLPIEIVNRGDPYTPEVAATVMAIMEELNFSNPYRLTWQSKVGPKAWQGPQTAKAIEGLAKNGVKDVCLVPVAFTSDHIETLYELDIELKEDADKLGINLTRAESLNDNPIYIKATADLVGQHMRDYNAGTIGPVSRQLKLLCPGCTNPRCAKTKGYFARGGVDYI